uniref:C-type lectin domain-containing protein n=1 Tax=Sciurus vulgaris TaxID=55149 RepID=A0A8D2BDZ7_SCIVU
MSWISLVLIPSSLSAPPPQVGLWHICSDHRLILFSLGLSLLLLVVVCVIGSQNSKLQRDLSILRTTFSNFTKDTGAGVQALTFYETITSLKVEVEDHRQELLTARSLNQKVVSVENSLHKQEQEFKADQSEMFLRVQQLAEVLKSLTCQLADLKSNGSEKTCCPLHWLEHDGSCYWFSPFGKSWPDADKDCQVQNSHLVVVTSLEEQKFLEKHMGSILTWMGLTDQNGPWRWVDGTDYKTGFKNWSPNQPDDWTGHGLGGGEDCAHFTSDGLHSKTDVSTCNFLTTFLNNFGFRRKIRMKK